MQQLEDKQARARSLRQRHLLERSKRVRELTKKVAEVHLHKRMLLHQRRACLDRRLLAAEVKRQAELRRRVSKAHDEETKGKEIAFIQTLEAEQKQYSILTKHEESRVRLNELAEERRRRLEEKLGREEAAKAKQLDRLRRAAARARAAHRAGKLAALEQEQLRHIDQLRSRIKRKAC
ncbi:unnamed protein product [Protopolystoma xenopodis]|uniref:Uncharacterized protein n=1 Tax=Protopolystoma xenopodis TaxID=117903 RepID=A0A3S5C5B9_9PLAT|nr:unnamed protein product [Protopolystoma xenopodis]